MIYQTPFDVTKASDFSDEEIRNLWVSAEAGYDLVSLLKPHSRLSMHVLGGKGSGKTHLLRYCSYQIQRLKSRSSTSEGVLADGYLGIYMRADGLNAGRFREKGVEDSVWRDVFAYYLELWMAELVVTTINDAFGSQLTEDDQRKFSSAASDLFNRWNGDAPASLDALSKGLRACRKDVDDQVNNAALKRRLEVDIGLTPGSLVFGLPKLLSERIPKAERTILLYMIDQYEDLSADQQRFVNTLVRHREGPATFRLGARLYGIKTLETYSDRENNKEGSEYEVLRLDSHLRRDPQHYAEFAKRLCAKRLSQVAVVGRKDVDERSSAVTTENLEKFFEDPDRKGLCETATCAAIKNLAGRPWINRLRGSLAKQSELNAAQVEVIVGNISHELPLVEKAKCLAFYQNWYRGRDLVVAASSIRLAAESYLAGNRGDASADIKNALSHFKTDLLAQIFRETGQPQQIGGLDDLIDMSAGMPRHLLIILKNIYSWALFNGEKPFSYQAISLKSQLNGIRDSANWFLNDAQIGEDAPFVKQSVSKLAELFRAVRFSDKPVECSVVLFAVNKSLLTIAAQRTIEQAENLSYLLAIPSGHKDKNSMRVDAKYQLNPMLAPRWDLPTARRGTLTLDADLANALFDPVKSEAAQALIQSRVAEMNAPFSRVRKRARAKAENAGLLSFDFEDED